MKASELLKLGEKILKDNDVIDYINDSKLLLEEVLKIKVVDILIKEDFNVKKEDEEQYISYINRRANKEPFHYIVNYQYIFSNKFFVDKRVFVPSFDTEILIQEVLNYILDNDLRDIKIIDMCAGSGCIGISLAKEILKIKDFNIELTLVDISKDALDVCEINAKRILGDFGVKYNFSNLFENVNIKDFDIIVSNPPYIRNELLKEKGELSYMPQNALDGGEDGLDFYKRIINDSKNHLKDNGLLALEIGYDQKDSVIELLEKERYCDIKSFKDYGKNDRVVLANRRIND